MITIKKITLKKQFTEEYIQSVIDERLKDKEEMALKSINIKLKYLNKNYGGDDLYIHEQLMKLFEIDPVKYNAKSIAKLIKESKSL